MASISLKYKSKQGNLTAPGDVDPGAMIPISTTTLSTATATVTFSNIPQNYEHLQLRYIARATTSGSEDSITLRFNSDSSSNYAYHFLFGNGSAAVATATTSINKVYPWAVPGSTFLASAFGSTIIDILDYSNTNKYKVTRTLSGYDDNSTGGRIAFTSGLWQSTNAITSISLNADNGNWATNSTFALYGIKRAGA